MRAAALLIIASALPTAGESFTLPEAWVGSKPGTTEGNPALGDGKPPPARVAPPR